MWRPSPVVLPAHLTTISPRRTTDSSSQRAPAVSLIRNRFPDTAMPSVPEADTISHRPVHASANDPVRPCPSDTDAGDSRAAGGSGLGSADFLGTAFSADPAVLSCEPPAALPVVTSATHREGSSSSTLVCAAALVSVAGCSRAFMTAQIRPAASRPTPRISPSLATALIGVP